jgi:hypothetical protein
VGLSWVWIQPLISASITVLAASPKGLKIWTVPAGNSDPKTL